MSRDKKLCWLLRGQLGIGVVSTVAVLLLVVQSASCASRGSTVRVEADSIMGPLPHIWNGVMGDLSLVLTPRGKRLLERIAETSRHPYYRRAPQILNTGIGFPTSSNIYHETKDGKPFYDFTLFDHLFDTIVDAGMVPFVCLSFMPEQLSSAPPQAPYRARYPPKDYDKWYALIQAVVGHTLERYGNEVVSNWRWEVWNEPDLESYWRGTTEEFIKLYDYTATAIKSVHPNAQVGGIAVAYADSTLLAEFVEHCLRGRNHKTGLRGSPLDFISFHIKGGGSRVEGNFTSDPLLAQAKIKPRMPNFQGMVERTRQTLKRISGIAGTAGVPVYLTEADIDYGVDNSTYQDPNAIYRNTEYFAAFQCSLAVSMLDLREAFPSNPVAGMIMDTFYFPGRRIFEGQRTLFTAEDIEKPIFNALRLLGKLGEQRLKMDVQNKRFLHGLASRSDDGRIQVMLCNFSEETDYSEETPVHLIISRPQERAYRVTHYRIDHDHSNAYTIWKHLGSPLHPDQIQTSKIKERMSLEKLEPDLMIDIHGDELAVSLVLPPHGVSLIVFDP